MKLYEVIGAPDKTKYNGCPDNAEHTDAFEAKGYIQPGSYNCTGVTCAECWNRTAVKRTATEIAKAFEASDLNFPPTETGTAEGATHYHACIIQPIELMQYVLTHEEFIGFLKGNIIKYSLRAGKKGDKDLDDIKATQYKSWLDAVLKGETISI